MSQDVVFDGGSEPERKRILELLHAYLDANAEFDWTALQRIWSHGATNVFFNLNGHTYVGLDQWTRLWQYYRDRLETGRWEPFDIKVIIRGEMAIVTCHRKTRAKWTGAETDRPAGHLDRDFFVSRSTMVMVKEADEWKTVHAHFSQASDGPRPGNI
jgi:hypothetical protein